MWTNAAIVLVLLGGMSPIVTGLVRAILHRRRERCYELAATQDIAMVGTLASGACLLAAAACGLVAWLSG